MMPALVSTAGVLLSLGFICLSAAINWRYGLSLSNDPIDQTIYAATSLLCDIGKALLPFFFWWALERSRPLQATISAVFWLACTAYSLSSAAGFVEMNTTTQAGTVSSNRNEHAELEALTQRKRLQLEKLGTVAPAGVLATRIKGLHDDPRWVHTKLCNEPRTRPDKTFCDEVAGLNLEREKAEAAERLESEIGTARVRLNQLSASAQSKAADPRVGLVTRLFQSDQSRVQLILSLLFVIVLELGSGLGLFIATSHGQLSTKRASGARQSEEPAIPPVGNVAKFARSCLTGKSGAAIGTAELYDRYRAWCREYDMRSVDRSCFGDAFAQLATVIGVEHAEKEGELVFAGLAERPS